MIKHRLPKRVLESLMSLKESGEPCWFGWYHTPAKHKQFIYMTKADTSHDADEAAEILENSILEPYIYFRFCGSIDAGTADKEDYWLLECKKADSNLDKLEEAAEYRQRLTLCPECGDTSFDTETGFCMTCGFN